MAIGIEYIFEDQTSQWGSAKVFKHKEKKKMDYVWEDLPKPLNCFTVRGTTMVNLNTGKIVSNYAANTKIVVVQKCTTPKGTYYRTSEAARKHLNYAFRASAFGLPDEKAPLAHSKNTKPSSSRVKQKKSGTHTLPTKKIKTSPKTKTVSSKNGEKKQHKSWFSKIFGKKNG